MTAVLTRRPGLSGIRAAGSPLHLICLALVVLVVTAAVLAPWLVPHDPNVVDLGSALAGTSADHPLGVDAAGRDTLSRLLLGARTSLLGPLEVVAFSTLAGVAVGTAAAWRGGRLDSLLSRSTELVFAFPGMLLAILIISVYGEGLLAPVIALAIAYLPYVSRLTRSLVLAERARPYVSAYRVQGHSALQICLRHVLPNIAPVVLAQATINFGYALMDLAGLSFLGLGIPALTPDWGRMVFDGQTAVQHGYPLSAILPCVVIVLTVVAFNVVGERWADRVARRDR
ncbi:ABC transporter permease [Streptomyces sp. NBC_00257]|uniref:ABC transporter permease n=1 Tax=Streptomyces sanglieri TaxID=193460 RepID=A0ABW2WUG5_9ACTN|nr:MULTISPECIES: ABC transporter permease [unclassified Streptomyces]WSG53964.1 ABC transporter permease [Streptomyces sp. NBC_01732]WSW04782.1 ABC transporter permease [Streptomyces sp. NBC_01005]WSX04595.1 ABC transporter permease [Streptomyces sp. NBC_00987]WTB57353.1 ABC transporter permease [Streptomyces sp. NBC_00826]WTC94286.1 ABC transporter permease [Streptomyces sp. NBC_01650]WTH89765.1 ABC transporter permease [Streptomyces sp. NBC_00825]WTH98492.1 ABC transporter permease [Strept